MYFFDGTFDPYDDRIFVNDADNDTESAHRRNRANVETVAKAAYTAS